MNKIKFFLMNEDKNIGIVYESEKYGRTITFTDKVNLNEPIIIFDENSKRVQDIDLLEFFTSMLPV